MKLAIVPMCLVLAACTGGPTTTNPLPGGQEYLFEVSYVNFAWGRQIKGVYIDVRGHVFAFDHSQSIPDVFDKEEILAQDLRELYANRTRMGRVSASELREMAAHIEAAERGELSDPVSVCRDAGATSYVAYTYDAQSGRYTPVELVVDGDVSYRNTSSSAKALFEWLTDVSAITPPGCGAQ